MAKLKHCSILTLAAVFSMAGVLSLLTSPAVGAPLSNANCENRADGIMARTLADEMDSDLDVVESILSCVNPCEANGDLEPVTSFSYKRSIQGQGDPVFGNGVLLAVEFTFPNKPMDPYDDDTGFGATLFGQIAFLCSSGKKVIVVGHPGPTNSSGEVISCPLVFQELCSTP